MKHRLLCDVDGVVSNFIGAAVRAINLLYGTNHQTGKEPTEWDFGDLIPPGSQRGLLWDALSAPGIAAGLEVLPHAVELVSELSQLGDLWFVTSPFQTSPTWCYERARWLQEHLGIDRHRVVFASDKSAVDGVVLIDDRAANLVQWSRGSAQHPLDDDERPHGAILWRQPYSGKWCGPAAQTVVDAVTLVEARLGRL